MRAMYPSKSIETYVSTVETAETAAFICFILVYSALIVLVMVFVSSLATLAFLFRRYRVVELGKDRMSWLGSRVRGEEKQSPRILYIGSE